MFYIKGAITLGRDLYIASVLCGRLINNTGRQDERRDLLFEDGRAIKENVMVYEIIWRRRRVLLRKRRRPPVVVPA